MILIDTERGAVRAVPIGSAMARALWQHRGRSQWVADTDLVWPNGIGEPRDYGNLYSRLLKPAARRAGLPWVSWHTLRRTCATLLVTEHGFLPNQVQTWLGHEDPHITLALYTQLTSDDLPTVEWTPGVVHDVVHGCCRAWSGSVRTCRFPGVFHQLRGRDSNPDYLIQSQASYH